MDKDAWIRKLTSRKFWMAIAGLVTGIVSFIKSPSTDAEAITGLVLAAGSVVAYIISEGLVDAASAGADTYIVKEPEIKPPEEEEEQIE